MKIIAGVLLAALLVVLLGNTRRLRKTKRLETDVSGLQSGVVEHPRWAKNAQQLEAFKQQLLACSTSKGLPELFVEDAFAVAYARDRLLASARIVERQGGSLAEQAGAACSQLEKTWASLSADERSVFEAASHQ